MKVTATAEACDAAAEFIHSNESLHRHPNPADRSCVYCDLVARYAVKVLVDNPVLLVRLAMEASGVEDGHFAVFEERHWFTEHSIECRLLGQMSDCEYHWAIARVAEDGPDDSLIEGRRWRITDIDTEGLPSLVLATSSGQSQHGDGES